MEAATLLWLTRTTIVSALSLIHLESAAFALWPAMIIMRASGVPEMDQGLLLSSTCPRGWQWTGPAMASWLTQATIASAVFPLML
jgi:hypothetical protein